VANRFDFQRRDGPELAAFASSPRIWLRMRRGRWHGALLQAVAAFKAKNWKFEFSDMRHSRSFRLIPLL
jgi:hypothetical protein